MQLVVQYGQLSLLRFEIEIDQVLLLDRVHLVDLSQGQQAALNFVDLWWMENGREKTVSNLKNGKKRLNANPKRSPEDQLTFLKHLLLEDQSG